MNKSMLLAIIVNIVFLLMGMSYGGPLSSFFDLPSVLILFLPVFLSVSGAHGFGNAITDAALVNYYKMWIRPHLEYGDVVFDKADKFRTEHNLVFGPTRSNDDFCVA